MTDDAFDDDDPRLAFLKRASALLACVVNDETTIDEAYDHLVQEIYFCVCTRRMMESFDRESEQQQSQKRKSGRAGYGRAA